MSAARETAVCLRLDRWLTAYVDGELDAVHCLEVEDHIEQCALCCERVGMLHAAKVSLRDTAAEYAPQSLRERVCRTLLEERKRADVAATDLAPVETAPGAPDAEPTAVPAGASSQTPPPGYLAKLRYIVPLAAAATIALMVGAFTLTSASPERDGVAVHGTTEAGGTAETDGNAKAGGAAESDTGASPLAHATMDTLLDDLVSQHAHPPQLDVTDPNEPLELRPILDQPLRGTAYEQDFGAKYIGARKTPRAGLLQYVKRNKNRVTMYVFNTRRVRVSSNKLRTRRVGPRKVYVGKVKGYPVAASERDGIGFAVTADDLSAEETSNLVLAASR